MNIRSVSNLVCKNSPVQGLKRRIFGMFPNVTVNNEELFTKIGSVISRPDVGRAIMGITAIGTQPFIDYYNSKVDRDTAKVSTSRTIGKIIAGTGVGCAVRAMCYYGTKLLTCTNPNAPKWRTLLLPHKKIVQYLNRRDVDWVKNYNSVVASLVGLGVMLFTNMMLDVPLTNYISKKVMPLFGLNPDKQKLGSNEPREINDVKDKILESFSNKDKWRVDR